MAKRPEGAAAAEFKQMRVDELLKIPAPYNPRVPMEGEEFENLKRSLRLFGAVEPCVVNRRTNRMVGGHQRTRAAAEEGFEFLPVMVVDLDEPSEMQLNVALNRIQGRWDEAKLLSVFEELERFGADLQVTGFSKEELDVMLDGWSADFAAHEKIGESDAPALDTIKVRCRKEDHDQVLFAIQGALDELGIAGIEVDA